jgi:hypothetical protein
MQSDSLVCIREQTPVGAGSTMAQFGKERTMLSTVVIVLVILWLLGIVTSYTAGGLIHILLVIAIVVVLLRVIQGRNPLRG